MITIFYIFSFLQVLTSSFILLANNPVHSILFLILLFFESLATLSFLNFEFISLHFIPVYVGAIAVLFLFVIMMLRVKLDEFDALFFLPLNFAINSYLILYLFSTMQSSLFLAFSLDVSNVLCFNAIEENLLEIFIIGQVLYNFAILLVVFVGLVLVIVTLLKKGKTSLFLKLSFFCFLVIFSQAKGLSLCEGSDSIETAASLAEVVPTIDADADASYNKNYWFAGILITVAAGFLIWYCLSPAVVAPAAVVITKTELPKIASSLPVTEVADTAASNPAKAIQIGGRWVSAWKDAPIPEVSSIPQPNAAKLAQPGFKMPLSFGSPKKVIDVTAIPDPFAEMKEVHWLVHPQNPDNVAKVTEAIVKIVTETPGGGVS